MILFMLSKGEMPSDIGASRLVFMHVPWLYEVADIAQHSDTGRGDTRFAERADTAQVLAVDATITHYHPGSITSSITPAAGIYTAITPDPGAHCSPGTVSGDSRIYGK